MVPMDSIEGIAAFSTAMSQAQLKSDVSTKVLKLAQGQQQVVADLLSSAMESVQQTIEATAGDAGGNLDAFA